MTRIMVIENEMRARQALKSILETAGYEVVVALDAAAAAIFHAAKPADLIVADGIESPPVGVRILAVPGGAAGRSAELAERLRQAGAHAILPKPFRRIDLLSAVESCLA